MIQTRDMGHLIRNTKPGKNHEAQISINQISNDEIEKKIIKKRIRKKKNSN